MNSPLIFMHWLLSCTMPAREDENECNFFDKNNKNTLCPYHFHLHSSFLTRKTKQTDISNNILVVFLSGPIIPAAVIYKSPGAVALGYLHSMRSSTEFSSLMSGIVICMNKCMCLDFTSSSQGNAFTRQ